MPTKKPTKPTDIWWVTTYGDGGKKMVARRRQGERLCRKIIGDNARHLAVVRGQSSIVITTDVDGWIIAASKDAECPTLENWPSMRKDC
jgi:hypothetical protein